MIFAKTTLALTQELIARPSITPEDAGCQDLLSAHLLALGFKTEHLPFADVKNLWARRGTKAPLLVFAGHTDVVPPGPWEQWTFPPFAPTLHDGYLYGRGAVDMKSGLAAMIIACQEFIADYPEHKGSIAFLLTSDEEGPALNGTAKVVEYLSARGEDMQWCILGEPSAAKKLGDTLKIGRRGSLNGKLTILGQQSHIAYARAEDNPIYQASKLVAELYSVEWDQGNAHFAPTSFQASNIHSGTGVTNVVPGTLEVVFNFRNSPEITAEQLKIKVENIVKKHTKHSSIDWTISARPFYVYNQPLIENCQAAVKAVTGICPELSTSGGTSDGRFIAPSGCAVVELGPCNISIHEIDERIPLADLDKLTAIYKELLIKLLG